MENLRAEMQKVWKQAVFYDTGMVMAGDMPVPWMDCKTFCLDGSLYCLLFLFRVNNVRYKERNNRGELYKTIYRESGYVYDLTNIREQLGSGTVY